MRAIVARLCLPMALATALALLAACKDDSSPPVIAGDGALQILDAGQLSLQDEFDGPTADPVTEALSPELLGAGVASYTCTTQGWSTSEVRSLTDRTALSQDESIYPGALIQGTAFQDGFFTPITIARGGGTIYMTGLSLAPQAKYSRTLAQVSGSSVTQAVADIIFSEAVVGTAAEASFSVVQTYSASHMYFSLGLDARYGVGSMSADLNVNTTSEKNYMLMKFTQKYFDIVFEDPVLATSVFAAGAAFSDPENQIGPGNPPLYVSKVSYGRQVFFIAESEYSALEVKAALEAAYHGAAEVDVDTGLDYGQVLSTTKMYYYVRGGSAGLALAPISQGATQADMYTAIRDFLGDPAAANFSSSSPGVPIAYTLKYLSSRQVAQMSYSVNYDKKDCAAVFSGAPPPVFKLYINGIDDFAEVRLNNVIINSPSGATRFDSSFFSYITLNLRGNWNTGSTNTVQIKVFNDGCWHAGINVAVAVDEVNQYSNNWDVDYVWPVCYGEKRRYDMTLNPTTGGVSVTAVTY